MDLGLRMVKRLALGALVVIGAAIVVAVITGRFAGADDLGLVPSESADVSPDRRGGAHFDFIVPADDIPHGFDDERDASALSLIPERQSQPIPPVTLDPASDARLRARVAGFLSGWERFQPGEPLERYQARFAAHASPLELDELSARGDSHQQPGIGVCEGCTTGSELTGDLDTSAYAVVRRADDRTAYVTTQGIVAYSGASSPFNGQLWRRSYAVLLERGSDGRWRVVRAAADTLTRER